MDGPIAMHIKALASFIAVGQVRIRLLFVTGTPFLQQTLLRYRSKKLQALLADWTSLVAYTFSILFLL